MELFSMEIWALIMFGVLMVALLLGYPVAFTLGAIGLGFGLVFLGLEFFNLLPMRIWGIMRSFTLLAVPLFIFMGVILEKTKLAEELLETMGLLFGTHRGGLALSIVIVGGLLAATTGVVGATVVTMGIIALPSMLKNHYSPALATGTIAASGTLGQIVPPSIILILLADVVGVPVGRLFLGAFLPGLLLISLYLMYISWKAWYTPSAAPALVDSHYQWDFAFLIRVIQSVIPVSLLIIAVLGSIFFGLATPTESAAIGALGALLLAALRANCWQVNILFLSLVVISGLISWWWLEHLFLSVAVLAVGTLVLTVYHPELFKNMRAAAEQTTRLTSMVFLILIGATAFGLVFRGMGGDLLVKEIFTQLPGQEWGFLLVSLLLIFVLGFFLDFLEICFIVVPILTPIAQDYQIDLLWFAILIAVNLQASFLTPPFGFSLFYLKAVSPPEIRMTTIYKGIMPFVILQILGMVLMILFPEIITWLPDWIDAQYGL